MTSSSQATNPTSVAIKEDNIKELEMAHLQASNQKLMLEIESLRRPRPWWSKSETYVPIVTMLLGIAGFWFTFYQFHTQQLAAAQAEENSLNHFRIQQYDSMQAEAYTREMESKREFFSQQLKHYVEASELAATIATTSDKDVQKAAIARFWVLYWGPLAVVEDASYKPEHYDHGKVEQEMVAFGILLRRAHKLEELNQGELDRSALSLSRAVRVAIGTSWDVDPQPQMSFLDRASAK